MMFFLRWPAVLVLLAMVLLSLAGAAGGAAALLDVPIEVPGLEQGTLSMIGQSTWLDVGLWSGATLFFLIAAVRLIRRTQGFWVWLLGFACYGGGWAVAQQSEGGFLATVQGLDPKAYLKPETLAAVPESAEAQIGVLAIILIVGLLVFVIDGSDRAYWDRQSA